MNNNNCPVITIELVNEPGQPAWWQATFRATTTAEARTRLTP